MNEPVIVDIEIVVDENDNSIYLQLKGFDDPDQAFAYAEHLQKYLPLMLFESEVIH